MEPVRVTGVRRGAPVCARVCVRKTGYARVCVSASACVYVCVRRALHARVYVCECVRVRGGLCTRVLGYLSQRLVVCKHVQ